MFTVDLSSFDFVLNRKSFAAHSFFADVETVGAQHNLVIRGSDKVSKTEHADCFEDRILNDDGTINDRNHRRFVVATGDDSSELTTGASDLIEFYSTTAPFSVKYAKLGTVALAVMPVLSMVFGHETRKKGSWKVGNFNNYAKNQQDAVVLAAIARLAKMAKKANTRDAIGGATPPINSAELLAAISALQHTISGAVPVVAPVPARKPETVIDTVLDHISDDDLLSSVVQHIAADPSMESTYIEAFVDSDGDTDLFISAIQTLVAESLDTAIAA